MSNIVVNYIDIIEAIGAQIQSVWYALKSSDNEEIVKEIDNIKKIEVSDEQSFNKKKKENKVEKGTVYIVARFGAGAVNYGSSVTPISLYVMGTANKVKPTQLLLGAFASTWTTKNIMQGLEGEENFKNALQVWNTPEIITNFNEIDADFKNLFRLTGNIVVGDAAVRVGTLTYIFDPDNYDTNPDESSETINIMSFQDGYRASLDPQPFGNTHNFTKSEVNFVTYTFSVSTYALNNHITADLLAVRGFRNRSGLGITSKFSPNDKMKIKIEFTNGFTNFPEDGEQSSSEDPILGDDFFAWFKVVDSQIGQEIAGIPTLLITFAR